MMSEFYKVRGWNKEGTPTKETLAELDLGYVSHDLERRGFYDGRKESEDCESSED